MGNHANIIWNFGQSTTAPPFVPTDIAGLLEWIDLSDITQLYQDRAMTVPVTANNDVIGAVLDKSGNANHMGYTGAAQPVYKTAIQNGLSVSRHAGNSNYERFSATPTTAQPNTYYLVWAKVAGGATQVIFDDSAIDAGPEMYYDGGTGKMNYYAGTGMPAGSAPPVYPTFNQSTVIFNGASSSAYLNQVLDSTGDAGSLSSVGLILMSSLTANFTTGDLAEALHYSGAHNATQRAQVETYLKAKWGL